MATRSRTPDDEPLTSLSLPCGLCGSHRRLHPGVARLRLRHSGRSTAAAPGHAAFDGSAPFLTWQPSGRAVVLTSRAGPTPSAHNDGRPTTCRSGCHGRWARTADAIPWGRHYRSDRVPPLTSPLGEWTLLRALIASPPTLNRHPLSRESCRGIGWFNPDGGRKDMMARVPMLTDRPTTARLNAYNVPFPGRHPGIRWLLVSRKVRRLSFYIPSDPTSIGAVILTETAL